MFKIDWLAWRTYGNFSFVIDFSLASFFVGFSFLLASPSITYIVVKKNMICKFVHFTSHPYCDVNCMIIDAWLNF